MKIPLLKMSEIDCGGISRADWLTDVRYASRRATIRMILSVGQTPEHGLTPRGTNHQVRNAGLLGGDGVAEVLHATEVE